MRTFIRESYPWAAKATVAVVGLTLGIAEVYGQSCPANQHTKGTRLFRIESPSPDSAGYISYDYTRIYRTPATACQAVNIILATVSNTTYENTFVRAEPATGNESSWTGATRLVGQYPYEGTSPTLPPPGALTLHFRYAGTDLDQYYNCLYLETSYNGTQWQYDKLESQFDMNVAQASRCEENCRSGYINHPTT